MKKELIFLINVPQEKELTFKPSMPSEKNCLSLYYVHVHQNKLWVPMHFKNTTAPIQHSVLEHLSCVCWTKTRCEERGRFHPNVDEFLAAGQIPLNILQGLIPTPHKYHRTLLNMRFLELSSLCKTTSWLGQSRNLKTRVQANRPTIKQSWLIPWT